LDKFVPWVKQHVREIPHATHLQKLIPVLLAQKLQELKETLRGEKIAVIYDGTTRVCECFAVVVVFLEDFDLKFRLVALSMIDDQLNGEMTAS
jgi:hypothetical protein